MSRDDRLRILAYDVSSNSRRRRIARRLEEEASRVQYSVFEGRMSARRLQHLVSSVEPLLEEGDSLRVYTISKIGERHCDVYGTAPPIEKDVGYWLL